jgi:hypothetical protein
VWPWEHLAFGYLVVALALRATRGRSLGDVEAVLVVLATQLPDLVDKPLAWRFEVLPAGLSLAHSLLFAGPLLVAVVALATWRDRPAAGWGVALAYGTHLVGDAVYPVVFGDPVRTDFLLWPVREVPPSQPSLGLLGHVAVYFDRFTALLATPRGSWFVALEVALVGGALVLWLFDGVPGLRQPWRWTVAALSPPDDTGGS